MSSLRLQSYRFVVVGGVSNAVLYLCYLLVTWLGLAPPVAVSVMFILGALQTFLINKSWTFSIQGQNRAYLIRYISLYGVAYLFNLLILHVFVGWMALNHRFVQAVAIIVIGTLLFFIQRNWVFSSLKLEKSGLVR